VHSLAHPLSTIWWNAPRPGERAVPCCRQKFCAERKPGLYRRVGIACGLDIVKSSDAEADQATIRFLSEFLAGIG